MMQKQSKKQHEENKLRKRLRRLFGQAVSDYNMLEENDLVMVCLSGGKDSFAMLELFLSLKRNAAVEFEIIAVNLDQKHPGYPEKVLPEYLKSRNIKFHIIHQDTYSVVKKIIPDGKTMCSLCSRLRRGALYKVASSLGANKIALGHHSDDILETFFLNLFYGGRLKTMPPKLLADDGHNIIIRPLAYCREKDLIHYSDIQKFPIIPCNLCGSQDNLQRKKVKLMLQDWEKNHPGRAQTIFSSLKRVTPSHLLDRNLHNFEEITNVHKKLQNGDIDLISPEFFQHSLGD